MNDAYGNKMTVIRVEDEHHTPQATGHWRAKPFTADTGLDVSHVSPQIHLCISFFIGRESHIS